MKTLLILILFLFATPAIAAPAQSGAFYDPDGDVFGEGINVTTSLSGKISFILYTTLSDCVEEDVCFSERRDFVSGLWPLVEGTSQGVLRTVIDEDIHAVGWYIFSESDTGYTLEILSSEGSPIDSDSHIYHTLFDFSKCIVSSELACLD